ncbi:Orn/Lys/Arg family decarboxylase [Acidocella aromatica]|uniref:Ornithine decarboxylase n=1 Tax=Acidocella aromatica TaxID=1303579 RepID=A0A840VVV1_9PROT|nr:Orn/Lys/Arg decarboxylase N-terminal domain-containing protein [Acidocella aromatica]MBB5374262.1 ornithine decarboxylase [Acidocella aromatica]
MSFEMMFRFLLAVETAGMGRTERAHLARLVEAVAAREVTITDVVDLADAEQAVLADASIGCILVEWGAGEAFGDVGRFIRMVRGRGLEMPIFLFARRHEFQEIDAETLRLISGYVFAGEDTPEFIAKNLLNHFSRYAESLKTPFFGAMVDYAEQGNQLWTCPGHNGGVFYRKSPIGNVFVEHLGEAVFRNDLDNSVVELGDLLVHEGPARQAEIEAAKIFGAERTYFVLNGTSTSNKIALSAIIAPGNLVLFDRNNHKAAVHGALLFGGGVPVYLETTRNAQGLIGPIAWEALDESKIRAAIRHNPLVADKSMADKPRPFRALVLEQCTYDGTIYSAEMLLQKLGPLCEYILFDEAWAGFMKFHPLFKGRYAMGLELKAGDPGVIATQSTHKQLAGFSQASQIHVKDSHVQGRARVEQRRFNELYMLHYSTSPFYPLFASLDVGAQMMRGRSGQVLWDDTVRIGIEIRKKLRALAKSFAAAAKTLDEAWFFDPFVPDAIGGIAWEELPEDELASNPQAWTLAPGAAWHGFPGLADGYAMTDPNKLTLLTPGFDRHTGAYTEHGIPAPVLAEFLRERRIVPEKNDLNSILFLLTPGVEASKAGTLLAALTAFKELHDANAPLIEVMPDFVRRHGARYAETRLRDLCRTLHDFYKMHDASRLQRECFEAAHLPRQVMTPRDAWEKLMRNEVDYIPLQQAQGRVAATLALVYPPGIGLIVPGERYGGVDDPVLDYFRLVEEGCNLFPGFENEIQGVYRETGENQRVTLYTYVLARNS